MMKNSFVAEETFNQNCNNWIENNKVGHKIKSVAFMTRKGSPD